MVAVMRPEILFPLFTPVSTLKGVGPRVAPLVERVAGSLVRDVLFTTPQSVIRRTATTVDRAVDGQVQTFVVGIDAHQPPSRLGQPWKIRAWDETGFLTLTWFKGHGPHLERQHPAGSRRAVSGKVERFGSEIQVAHPEYLLPEERAAEIPEFEPVYSVTAGLPSRTFRRFALEALERAAELPEWQDPAWKAREAWPGWREAFAAAHNPAGEADVHLLSPHRRRLAYDELLAHQLALAQRKASRRAQPAPRIGPSPLADDAEKALPFRLTGAQIRALSEVRGDLASGERMSRLLQGDVGSGKTVVGMLAIADAAGAGLQSAFMAPTEILARQHYETIAPALTALGLSVILLTGRDKGAGRANKLAGLASGSHAVAIGTHALFQDDVVFKALGLSIIDEQHRFGVNERRRLQDKGDGVHLLAMSATPIPRTLELTVFGDLDVSRIDEKPPGRTPVATRAVPMPRLPEIVARLKSAAEGGAQAFWICPLVSESEKIDLRAAVARAEDLRQIIGSRWAWSMARCPPPRRTPSWPISSTARSRCWSPPPWSRSGSMCPTPASWSSSRPNASAWPSCTSCAAGSVAARGKARACCYTTRRCPTPPSNGWTSCASPTTASRSPRRTWSCAAAATRWASSRAASRPIAWPTPSPTAT
jgi:ATP-dependent DNA helicase RecG